MVILYVAGMGEDIRRICRKFQMTPSEERFNRDGGLKSLVVGPL